MAERVPDQDHELSKKKSTRNLAVFFQSTSGLSMGYPGIPPIETQPFWLDVIHHRHAPFPCSTPIQLVMTIEIFDGHCTAQRNPQFEHNVPFQARTDASGEPLAEYILRSSAPIVHAVERSGRKPKIPETCPTLPNHSKPRQIHSIPCPIHLVVFNDKDLPSPRSTQCTAGLPPTPHQS